MSLERVAWRAADSDAALAVLDELYGSPRWSPGVPEKVRFAQDAHAAEGVSFMHLEIGTSVARVHADTPDFMAVALVDSGRYWIRSDGMEGSGEHVLLLPNGHLEAGFTDLDLHVVHFSMDYLDGLITARCWACDICGDTLPLVGMAVTEP